MKVLLVTRAGTGGAARHVRDAVAGLSGRHEIEALASPREDPEYLAVLAAAGARVIPLPLARGAAPRSDVAALVAIRAAVRRFRPDVVHAHAAKPGALARLAAGRTPVVYSPHGFFHDYPTAAPAARTAARIAERALAGRTAVLAACAEFEAAAARRQGLAPGGRVVVVPNGVPMPAPVPPGQRRARRALLGAGEGDFVVLMIARLAPPKDPGTFVAAAERAGAGFRFVLVGDGPLLAPLRAPAEHAGVRLAGAFANAADLLPAADAAVLSSRFEAAPYSLLEAMAAGVPCVCADLPAAREALGEAGLFFPPGDAASLAAAVTALRDAPARAVALGRLARARAADHHSLPRMLAATEQSWLAAHRCPSHWCQVSF